MQTPIPGINLDAVPCRGAGGTDGRTAAGVSRRRGPRGAGGRRCGGPRGRALTTLPSSMAEGRPRPGLRPPWALGADSARRGGAHGGGPAGRRRWKVLPGGGGGGGAG